MDDEFLNSKCAHEETHNEYSNDVANDIQGQTFQHFIILPLDQWVVNFPESLPGLTRCGRGR
jgi:hypothetical protein